MEITIDFVADRTSRLLGACARSRLATRGGQTTRGESLHEPVLIDAVARIVEHGRLVGPGNVQVFRTADGDLFSEVNARPASGGLMNSRAAGVDVPLLWLQAVLGTPPADTPVIGRPGVLMLKYWNEVIVPAAARDAIQPALQPSAR
jgi:carbamoyl-phosphate synthase large subunit